MRPLIPMPDRALRVLFAVQGEGRGHMTQALAMAEMLRAQGHEVAGALVGRSARREVPAFFREALAAPITEVDSPNFVLDPETRAVDLVQTCRAAMRRSGRYQHSLRVIGRQIAGRQPDVVVNFYDGLMGLFSLVARPTVPVVAVGHQFMFGHPAYRFVPGQRGARLAMQAYTRLAGAGAAARLALSFYPAEDRPGLTVCPPLLRRRVFELAGQPEEDFFLVYLLDPDLAGALERWHARHAHVRLRVYWSREDLGPCHRPHPNLEFRPLAGEAFLRSMAAARGVVCTAGFETVSEALLLGKPAFMVPTPGHLEQRCNAIDAAAVGAGLPGTCLTELDRFLAYAPAHVPQTERFRAWATRAEAIAVGTVERAGGVRAAPYRAAA